MHTGITSRDTYYWNETEFSEESITIFNFHGRQYRVSYSYSYVDENERVVIAVHSAL